METKKIKVEDFPDEKKSDSSFNLFDKIPEESFQMVLSNLSCEEVQKIRSVSRKFNNSCQSVLRKSYNRVKQEVKNCAKISAERFLTSVCDNCRIMNQIKAEEQSSPCSREAYYDWLFWVVVEQTLNKSFQYFNIFEGYLVEQYVVSEKTLDVVEYILRWKEKSSPYLHLVNSMLESDGDFSHYFAFQEVYIKWLIHKKKTDRVRLIYVPASPRKTKTYRHFPKCANSFGKRFHSMILDVLTTLLTRKNNSIQPLHTATALRTWEWDLETPFVIVFKTGEKLVKK